MKSFMIALQLYSIREDAAKDLRGALASVKEMGYDGVELAGLYDHTPEEWRSLLGEFNLTAISAHVPYQEIMTDIDGTIGKYVTIGCPYIAIPYLSEETRPGSDAFPSVMENIKKIGERCNAQNITLLYHNHDFEFVKMDDGRYGLDYLYEEVDSSLLQTEIDTCWVKVSGLNPADYIRKYTGRSPIVHLKDFVGERSANMYELIGLEGKKEEQAKAFAFRAVGRGVQDFAAVLDAAHEAGAKWVVVEQDQHNEYSALEDAKFSIDYVRSLLK